MASVFVNGKVVGQCSITNATSCVCATAGQTNCDLLPDMTISWSALANYASGPSEYSQSSSSNPGRLRVSGSTPNIGKGNLEVRGVTDGGFRAFICGTDTNIVAAGQQSYTCPQGQTPRQVLYQRIYHKNGSAMTYTDKKTGTMTYHPNHGHYHVDDWTTMTLRIQDPSEPLPTKWPIVATGAKIGFCLMDYYDCWSSSAPGHCRTAQGITGSGSQLNTTAQFPNNGLYRGYSCGADYQGISTGRTDVYSESLEGMWINLMPNLCDSNYWIVAEVDPTNVFQEENEENNWAAIPFRLALQRVSGSSGGSGYIHTDKAPIITPNGTVTLTATPGYNYLWNTGATSRSITVSQPGNYSCVISAPCGSLATGVMNVTSLAAPPSPAPSGATIIGPASTTLVCPGTEPQWYAAPTGGVSLNSGTSFTTPVLAADATYWVSDRNKVAATSVTAGKGYVPSHGSNYNGKQWLLFDAYQPFTLRSVQVYSNAVGMRHFVLVDNVGNLIAEKQLELGIGLQTVQLGFRVPAGTQHKISAYDSGATSSGTQLIFQDLHRSTVGVSYPYSLGTLGAITGSTEGASVYHFLYNWQVETEEVTAESARVPVTVQVTNGVVLDLKAMLEGPFDQNADRMHDSLRVANIVPLTEPFTGLGFTHAGGGGGETLPAARLTTTGDNAIVDWVLVELRSASNPSTIVATQSGVITRAGEVQSTTGSDIRLSVTNGSYFVALRHRNHLGVMTAAATALTAAPTTIDFSLASTPTYGTQARKTLGARQLLWAGEVVRDRNVMYTGGGNDRDVILQVIGGIVPTNVANGYLQADGNLDGKVKYTGAANDRDLILSTIGGVVPTNVRPEQLP
ncbi:MAG: hypothetical protein JNL43_06965 [Flavobacteriales bacterium]|nr:hypothetical protein [Flavobacteriales bacterium]